MSERDHAVRYLYRSLRLSDWAGRQWKKAQRGSAPKQFQPGLSVVIPERSNALLLSACLESVKAACGEVAEPCEVIVVVSGASRVLYRDLIARHALVHWIFSDAPLWFGGAIQRGLAAARYDWVYLLNNDMVLDAAAFSSLLPWRGPDVFGIASQIYFQNPDQRREETGWTVCRKTDGMLEILDQVAEDDVTVRGTFYPGGGASLFRRDLLASMAEHTGVYAPFYWEDVEWGTRAWRVGYASLYCPGSKAWHGHRQTNRRFFSEPEIDRILNRNRFIFHLRNGPLPESFKHFRELIFRLDEKSLAEILTRSKIFEIAAGRLRNVSRWLQDPPLDSTWQRHYGSILAPWQKV